MGDEDIRQMSPRVFNANNEHVSFVFELRWIKCLEWRVARDSISRNGCDLREFVHAHDARECEDSNLGIRREWGYCGQNGLADPLLGD